MPRGVALYRGDHSKSGSTNLTSSLLSLEIHVLSRSSPIKTRGSMLVGEIGFPCEYPPLHRSVAAVSYLSERD